MKGGEIFDSVVDGCLQHELSVHKYASLFHSAVLCMGQKLGATDDDIYKKYFEREKVRTGLRTEDMEPVSSGVIEVYNETDRHFKGITSYLPPSTQVLRVHIEIYKTMMENVPVLQDLFESKAGGRELTTITTYLMGGIVDSVRQLHAKHN